VGVFRTLCVYSCIPLFTRETCYLPKVSRQEVLSEELNTQLSTFYAKFENFILMYLFDMCLVKGDLKMELTG
jgi:hypothetical protein